MTKLLILFLSLFINLVLSDGQTLGSDNCCVITTPQHFSSTLRRNDGNVLMIRNSREILPNYYGNFYTGSSSNSGNLNFGVVDTDQNQNYGTFGQTQTQQQYQIPQQSQQNFNGFAQYGTGNGFDANTWAQTNANLFQQQQANGYGIQQNNFGSQTNVGGGYGHNYGQATNQNYGQTQTQNQNYGQSQIQNQNYGGGLPQQTFQTFYPYSSTEQQQLPQQVQQPYQQQTNQQPYQQQTNQQPYQPVVDPFIQQSYVAPEVAPQTQASQYGNNFPQSSYSAPAPAPAQVVSEPEPVTVQPTIDLAQLQQYAQYLEQIQKQYGIKLPSTQPGASAPQNQVEIHTSQNPYASAIHPQIQTHVDIQNHQNPYAAAVQPQTQTHIQGTLNPVVQGTYSVPVGGSQGANSFNSWQTGFNNNYNQQIQAPSRPMNMISPSDSVYQAPQSAPVPAPAPVQQPYFPDYSNSNTVIDQSQPAPHIILPEPRQVIQPQSQPIVHVQQPVPQSQSIVHIQQPQPQPLPTIHIQQPSPVQSQSVYIPPTQATTLPPTRPSPMTQEYEYTTQQPQQPSRPISTTSIQALTQQIRKLPAVLYVDSRNSDTKRLETLLRENYGLPLVAFYIDKIDKPKTVERHLQQLTAHKGMPYLFICGTFIGSQQHIDNYHNNKQIPQLVEYVCGDEKKRKTQKRKKSSASTL